MKSKLIAGYTLVSTLFISACSSSMTKPVVATLASAAVEQNTLQAAWVVIGENGIATARVVTLAAQCPVIIQDGVSAAMLVRAQPATIAPRPIAIDSAALSSDKPSAFPVLTCESTLKSGVAQVTVAETVLPVPRLQPLKILVLGDSGCRMKAEGNVFQSCNDAGKWAFPTVIKTAARFAPDLVIHVGDYQYRESPCPADIAACADSPWGYGWDTWQADFFSPAAPLLAAAPWVMARGNHESCARAGQGWWRFLDPRPLQAGRNCNRADDDMQGNFSAPYAVPLGGNAQLILFDSAKAAGKPLEKKDPAYVQYRQEFEQVDQLARHAEFSIFVEHHPILGFAPEKSKAGGVEIRPGNLGLQSVLRDVHPQRLFDPHIQLLLSGHVHLFEAITFDSDHPMQVVSGNGGSSPDVDLPAVLPLGATPYAQARVAHLSSTSLSGFMTMERRSAASQEWVLKSYDQNGVLLTTCTASKAQKSCS